jgi:hypothetical protein
MLKLRSDRVYHFGKVPAGCHGAEEQSLVSELAGEMAVGDFTHEDGSRWVMIVNRDMERSHPCSPKFRKTPKRVQLMSAYTGTLMEFEGEQRWLAPGQGVLLNVE